MNTLAEVSTSQIGAFPLAVFLRALSFFFAFPISIQDWLLLRLLLIFLLRVLGLLLWPWGTKQKEKEKAIAPWDIQLILLDEREHPFGSVPAGSCQEQTLLSCSTGTEPVVNKGGVRTENRIGKTDPEKEEDSNLRKSHEGAPHCSFSRVRCVGAVFFGLFKPEALPQIYGVQN